MRITKKERKVNANKFYRTFMESNCKQAAIVVQRFESSNPNINRCQFLAVTSTLAFGEKPIVIAESSFGIAGCFEEMLQSIRDIEPLRRKSYWDDGFNEWLEETYKFRITYKDGLVFMFERR